jgi:hypothetical protein
MEFPRLIHALLAVLALACGGCASVSVTGERLSHKEVPQKAPEVIWVRDFGYKLGSNQTEQHGPALKPFLDEQTSKLTIQTVGALRKSGFRTGGLGREQRLPPRGWLIAGNVTWLASGNRWLRTGVGFGEGATRLDTEVLIFDLEQRDARGRLRGPFYAFRTTGGSGIAPGIVPGVVASGVVTPITVVGGTLKAQADLDDDTRRTGRMISGALQDYLADNALISKEQQRQHAKRKGDYTGSWFDEREGNTARLGQ